MCVCGGGGGGGGLRDLNDMVHGIRAGIRTNTNKKLIIFFFIPNRLS